MKCKLCHSCKIIKLKSINSVEIKSKYKIDIKRFFTKETFEHFKCLTCNLKFFDNVLTGDSLFYDQLQENTSYYEKDKVEFDYALSKIAQINPSKILEIGAGRGYFAEKIKDSYNIKVSEFSQKSMKYLKEKNISFDEKHDTYDFICAFQVLEHVEDINSFLNYIDSKLNENGSLLISVPNNDSEYFKNVFDVLDYPPHHMYQFSSKSLHYIGKKMNYSLKDYWTEPMRIEHYFNIIKAKRFKLMKAQPIKKTFFALFDYLLTPYFHDDNLLGHTHAILFKKEKKHEIS
ncbi:hypothetical protein CJ673_06185 [Aliarcobacter cryaerophilus]|uniref:Class I SAM-dependent methyltransferase n=1 Tax=Aliarcobacter cryaerophilus TaxID=28198 RepID=A0A2S9T6L2_9BACT|nr:class I SAM-dependent methyltransferase [Aliarcobacter cryaerophilus]PRM94475.1 hypothetical protein CJ673_06185 [Aliarcobacter cryaerophilus]